MMQSLAVLGSPRRYVQGPGALAGLGELAGELGSKHFVVADPARSALATPAGADGFVAVGGTERRAIRRAGVLPGIFPAAAASRRKPPLDTMTAVAILHAPTQRVSGHGQDEYRPHQAG